MPENQITLGITGAGGFIGAEALDFFLSNPMVKEVRALYSHSPDFLPRSPRESHYVGELSDRTVCHSFLEGVDVILHFAHRGFPSDLIQTPASIAIGNMQATATLLEAMKAHGTRRIIFASSAGGLYRDTEKQRVPFTENAPIDLRSPYALSKITIENLLHYYERAENFEPIILRISNPFGAGQLGRSRQGVIGVILHRLLTETPMPIWGSLETVKDFLYVDDLLLGIASLLSSQTRTGLFHVGSGMGTSLAQIVALCEQVTGKKLTLEFERQRPTDTDWCVLDTSKLQKLTGWRTHWTLEAGIEKSWRQILDGNAADNLPKAA